MRSFCAQFYSTMGIPSCIPWQYCRTYGLEFPTSPTISGVGGVAGGHHSDASKPPCTSILDTKYKGPSRSGLTPACGFAHARNGRECGLINAVNATLLPRRGALRKIHGCVRLSRERLSRPYTLHPTHSTSNRGLKAHNGGPYLAQSSGTEGFKPQTLKDIVLYISPRLSHLLCCVCAKAPLIAEGKAGLVCLVRSGS